jgi:hypothetical protein
MFRKFITKFYKLNNKKSTMKAKVGAKAPKKSVRSAKKKKPLVVAEEGKRFWVHDGPVLKDMFELRDSLLAMTDEQFTHHVGDDKNDFSVWVCEVLCDKECAKKLSKAKTRKEIEKVLAKTIREYM